MDTEERQAPMPMQYDQQQQTRVYQRERKAQHAETQHDERIGFTQPLSRPKGVMDGLSIAQVIAGAAAAATSMLLSSKIGIAGSVIGAAVSSAVTIICSQLYRRALDASAEKLKQKQAKNSYPGATPYADTAFDTTTTLDTRGVSGRAAAGGARAGRNGARVAPTKLQARAAAARSATQKKVIAVSIVLAIAAVAATAGIILFATAGEGLGDKVTPLLTQANSDTASATSQQSGQNAQDSSSQGTGTASSDAAGEQSSDANASNSGTSSSDSSQSSNSSGNSTNSSNSGTSGSGNSSSGDSSQGGADSSTDTSGGTSDSSSGDSGTGNSSSDSGTSSDGTNSGAQSGTGQDSASAHATMES